MKLLLSAVICLFIFFQLTAQPIPVGIQMGTAREIMKDGVEEGLAKLKNMGITYIEGTGAQGMSSTDYKKLLDKYGIKAIAGGLTFEKLEDAEYLKTTIENLKIFDAQYAICYWIPHNGDDFTFANMENAVRVFNKAGKQFADAGISFLYHPHGYEFRPYSGPGTMFDYLLEKTDPRYVNFEMDVFWIRNPGQNPAALMRKYPGRFPLTHLKDRLFGSVDNLNGRQDKERNVLLGSGDVNIAEVMKASKEIGVKYHLIEDESERATQQLPMHLAYLQALEYDVQAIGLVLDKLHKSMVDVDSMALANLTAEELTYGHSSGVVEDKITFMENLLNGSSDFAKIDFSNVDITVKGDVAWVRGVMNADVVSKDKTSPITLKMLYIWIKDSGVWKLLARQAVR